MIVIKTLFDAVFLDDNTDFAVYRYEYSADKFGNQLSPDDPAIDSLHYYEYGDLIIETKDMKYIFKKIYTTDDVAAELIDILSAKKLGESLVVDIGKLGGRGDDDYDAFELNVETK